MLKKNGRKYLYLTILPYFDYEDIMDIFFGDYSFLVWQYFIPNYI